MTFELMLTGEKVKPHQIIALHLMAALVFIGTGAVLFKLYPPGANSGIALAAMGAFLLLLSIFQSKWVSKDHVNFSFRIAELIICIGVLIFTINRQWMPPTIMFSILGATLLLAVFWEKGREQKRVVKVTEEGIQLPASARGRFIPWHDAEQVLLRFGTLTIDCQGNKLYQWTVANVPFNNKDFETFCRRQIETGKTRRPKNDW